MTIAKLVDLLFRTVGVVLVCNAFHLPPAAAVGFVLILGSF